jgi:diguanylate cyclase (GGDEF)-like protein
MSISVRIANLSISNKMLAAFAIILSLFAGLGGTALQRLGAMHGVVEHIASDTLAGSCAMPGARGLVADDASAVTTPHDTIITGPDRIAEATAAHAAMEHATGRWSIMAVLGVATIVSALALTFLVRSVAMPIGAMAASMRRLAGREAGAEFTARHRADEVGQMEDALRAFSAAMIRVRAQADLIETILESMEQGVVAFDSAGTLVASNRRFRRMHDLPADLCLPGRHILDLTRFVAARGDYGPGDPETLARARWSTAARGDAFRALSTGPNGWIFAVTSRPIQGGGFVNTYTDVTEARAAAAELRESEARYRLLAEQLARQNAELELGRLHFDVALDSMSQGLSFFDGDGTLIVCNRRYREIYGIPPERGNAGTPLLDILQERVARGSFVGMTVSEYVARTAKMVGTPEPTDFIDTLSNGRTISVHFQPLSGGRWVTTHEDITERLRAETALIFMARHDALTRLPNRVMFQERLEQAVEMAGRGTGFAVLCLDLDHFKLINDTLGHPIGDGLLRAVADRLQACVREIDTVARLGGDEFAIIQLAADRPEDAELLAKRILATLAAPFDIDGHRIVVGTSVGVAMAPGDGTAPDTLIKNADIALYLAKTESRGAVRFFQPEMDASIRQRRLLESDLRHAVARGEFEIHYQPVVNLAVGRVSAFEALLRWQHPIRGHVLPAEFIPIAEETGLIIEIGTWVLRTACLEATTWPADIRIAVNLSPVQFRSGDLVAVVRAALDASGLRPDRLELEITESVLLRDNADSLNALHQLGAMGVTVALDDFGTGYSSLSYLRRFPFSKIKIDQSFVRDLPYNREAASIVRAVAGLSNSLSIRTTAEGVETQEQLDKLREEGCTEFQGYFFSRPRPARELPSLIERLRNEAMHIRGDVRETEPLRLG